MGLKNKDGVDIKDCWKDGVRTYLGMLMSGFPNAFIVFNAHGKHTKLPFILTLPRLGRPRQYCTSH
jgi:cation diffusion facilitator CzcD-associated flavoprotein CzcO